jgi:hypothetical protein
VSLGQISSGKTEAPVAGTRGRGKVLILNPLPHALSDEVIPARLAAELGDEIGAKEVSKNTHNTVPAPLP